MRDKLEHGTDFNSSISAAQDDLLTVEEVAMLLKVPKSWVYQRTRQRGVQRLPHIKLGKYLRFEETAIREFVARNRKSK